MSFGFGLGDVALAITLVKKVYDRIKEAPKQLHNAIDDVDLIDAKLAYFQEHDTADEQAFIKRHGKSGQKLADLFRRFSSRTEPVLLNLRALLDEWRSAYGSVVNEMLYTMLKLSKVEDLLEDLNMEVKRLDEIRDMLDHGAINNLDEARIAQEERRRADDKEQRQLIEKLVREEVEAKGAAAVQAAAANTDAISKTQIEKDLAQKGLSPAQIEKVMSMINENVSSCAQMTAPKPKTKNAGSILVVDKTNGVHSVASQGYLELLRSWTANTSGSWLFNKVASAGFTIETNFARKIAKLNPDTWKAPGEPWAGYKTLIELAGTPGYFGTPSEPHEKENILTSLRQHKGRGIEASMFAEYDYILCFDKRAYRDLHTLMQSAKNNLPAGSGPVKSKIMQLENNVHFTRPIHERVEAVKAAIKTWIKSELNWKRPLKSITTGPYRTKQIWAKPDVVGKLVGKGGQGLKKIREETGCRVRVAPYGIDAVEHGQCVSITGERGNKLKQAVGMVEKIVGE